MEHLVGWVEHCVWEGRTFLCVDCGGTVYCV